MDGKLSILFESAATLAIDHILIPDPHELLLCYVNPEDVGKPKWPFRLDVRHPQANRIWQVV